MFIRKLAKITAFLLKICFLVSNQYIFSSCIVKAIYLGPNNKVSEF